LLDAALSATSLEIKAASVCDSLRMPLSSWCKFMEHSMKRDVIRYNPDHSALISGKEENAERYLVIAEASPSSSRFISACIVAVFLIARELRLFPRGCKVIPSRASFIGVAALRAAAGDIVIPRRSHNRK